LFDFLKTFKLLQKSLKLKNGNLGRREAKLVARLLATTALWVRISQKYKMGDIIKGVAKNI
jgi:hypothetical protein